MPRNFNRPKLNHSKFEETASVEICLLDENGDYSPNGDLYDLTNDRELPASLNSLTPMLRSSSDNCAELMLAFEAEMHSYEGDRDEYGQLMSPRESSDVRVVTSAFLLVDGRKIPVDNSLLPELSQVFQDFIDNRDVNTEPDFDDRDERRVYESASNRTNVISEGFTVKSIANIITEDPNINNL